MEPKMTKLYLVCVLCVMDLLVIAGGYQMDWSNNNIDNDITNSKQLDVIDALNISRHTYNSNYSGLALAKGLNRLTPAIHLTGFWRSIKLPESVSYEAARLMSRTNDFTLLAAIKQQKRNTGTIISFCEGKNRLFEVQSSGRKDELRIYYRHKNVAYTQTFAYHLADDNWHQLAVSVSGAHVDIYIDCNRIYRRLLPNFDKDFTRRNVTLWLGQTQRHFNHFLFKGYMQDVKLVFKAHGYIVQCPQSEQECPTCGQFKSLQNSFLQLENYVKDLTHRLIEAEKRLSQVETCDCIKTCHINGSIRPDGASWKNGCDICSCVHGEVSCHPERCPSVLCKNPVVNPGECCRVCRKSCVLNGRRMEHGDRFIRECHDCVCENGIAHCKRTEKDGPKCPKLDCPPEKQSRVAEGCCLSCIPELEDHCDRHECHPNATCRSGTNSRSSDYQCHCKPGFRGNGRTCADVDECLKYGGKDGHQCWNGTVCVNLPGKYACECLSGHRRLNDYECLDHDECLAGEDTCHEKAVCINRPGSYICECRPGFEGDGVKCEPRCNRPCLNGGKCVAPDICSCRRGYKGDYCELDIDECDAELQLHSCPVNSRCVNMVGWYYCECMSGFRSRTVDTNDGYGEVCDDVDECSDGSHTCHGTATCVNLDGGYKCDCTAGRNANCSASCFHNGLERRDSETWMTDSNECQRCNCHRGVVTCQDRVCNCDDDEVNIDCCPQCDTNSRCHDHDDRTITYASGDTWTFECQTCECMFGEIDCWDMKCPPATCSNPIRSENDCCPRCEDDPCDMPLPSGNGSQHPADLSNSVCYFRQQVYVTGEKVPVESDQCSSCRCQNGRLCCKYNSSCGHNINMNDLKSNSIVI